MSKKEKFKPIKIKIQTLEQAKHTMNALETCFSAEPLFCMEELNALEYLYDVLIGIKGKKCNQED